MKPEETARLGELFRRLGILEDSQLLLCLDRQRRLKEEGKPAPLGQIAVDLGFVKPEQVRRALAHEGTAILRCPGCDRRFTVKKYEANRRYRCGACRQYLEFSLDDNLRSESEEPAAEDETRQEREVRKDPFVGRQFGSWRLTRMIGKGGMGVVYLAERVADGTPAAVKILSQEFSRIPDVEARFRREGKAGGRLDHPNIVQVYETGREGGHAFLATEFVDGESLESLILREKRLSVGRASAILEDILAGLGHAHECGVAHRDIKPANILLTREGSAKLIDFGLATDAEAQTVLTLTGKVMGTPSYMSPEQARGERGGPLSDLYACGVLTYVMLAGRRPFEGRSLIETLEMQVKRPPPSIRETVPEVPPGVDEFIRKMMAKDPAKRPAGADRAVAALRKATGREVPSPARGLSPLAWGLIVLGVAAGVLALLLILR